jgi:glycosyltransferase involved in cell wall biosynthesis
MTKYKKVVRFMINRHDGASQYDHEIDNALRGQLINVSYIVQDIKDYKKLPRFLAFIIFWLRAHYMLFLGHVDIAVVSPWMMFIYPKGVSVICISHHYDPSIFKGMRKIYVKLSHWLFIYQSSRVDTVVSCSKYWSRYYKEIGFKKTTTIFNGFDIKSMDQSLVKQDNNSVLKKFNLISKKYFHLGSYGVAKGQKIAVKYLKDLEFPMIATSSSKEILRDDLKDVYFINASFDEYSILLKNAKAVICMSEFKEGWCRVLHEAAIHGTPILGSGLGGMNELLEVGGFTASTADKLRDDLDVRIKEGSLSNDKVNLYRAFTLERFYKAWRNCVGELLNK